MTNARTYWLHALSPIHVGTGRGVGIVDLPIIREAVTNWPYVPGSAVKGVLADDCRASANSREEGSLAAHAFGRGGDETDISGSLVFSDAHLLCLPVRSLYGTFAWCTSALALGRFQRDLKQLKVTPPDVPEDKELTKDGACRIRLTENSPLNQNGVYFEDLDFKAKLGDKAAQEWAKFIADHVFPGDVNWQAEFTRRFAIVPNTIFDFLCETGTEIVARVQIDADRKAVAEGPWYEESLPAESLLTGFVWCDRVFGKANGQPVPEPRQLLDEFCSTQTPRPLQMGGKATIGKGRVVCRFHEVPPAQGTST